MLAEDLSANPFLTILKSNFQKLYKSVAAKQSVLLIPCAASLVGVHITQIFIETHILQNSHIPGNFLNLIGQGVEIRDGCVLTNFGFKEQRVCNVLQEENMYDHSASFKVVCIDRPLQGNFAGSLGTTLQATPQSNLFNDSQNPTKLKETVQSWLRATPFYSNLEEKLLRFEKTYILTDGLENDAANRMSSICTEIQIAVDAFWRVSQQNSLKRHQLHQMIERYLYIRLHPFLWPHFEKTSSAKEAKLQKAIAFLTNNRKFILESLQVDPVIRTIDIKLPADKLKSMDNLYTPHEKLQCLQEVYQLLIAAVDDETKKTHSYSNKSVEVSGDDILSLFIATIAESGLLQCLSHLAHMEMLLSTADTEDRTEMSSYYFTTFHSALTYILQAHSNISSI